MAAKKKPVKKKTKKSISANKKSSADVNKNANNKVQNALKRDLKQDKVALILSIIPGVGQLYKKDWVDFFAVYFGFLVALWCFGVKNILPEEMFWYVFLTVLGWLIVAGTYIWNLYDAYHS
ncbi:MAG: hypothetical protein ABIC91_02220 [Nanoarchaeota archaeon]|nr:hypothetical protein [Nanoarchaeota archaeon]MBU1030145.1 hypothetical protein [Nanoarchaeota archaeon]MBU1850421.1 hypothetical protein [Nanoarchaeota archaeon]